MAVDDKYGQIDIPGVPDDMPVFILLAKDKHTLPTLARYRNFAVAVEEEGAAPAPEWLENLDATIGKFAEFSQENANQMKLPD